MNRVLAMGVLGLAMAWAGDDSKDTNPPAVQMIGPGLYRVGAVLVNRDERTVSFESQLNTNAGPMEYLLVHERGKVHESILKTSAEPFHIHTAMLLLGVAPSTNSAGAEAASGPIEEPAAIKLPGRKIEVTVSWTAAGRRQDVPGGELVFNTQANGPLTNAAWVYNGSRMISGRYIAQIEGSIISLITDAGAQVNQTGPGHDNDQIWTASTNRLPRAGVPARVTLKLAE
jgi:hypothetical protein